MLTASLEDYLEEIYRLSLTNQIIRVSDIANCLSVSLPSVVKALRKLNQLKIIEYERYRRINLTNKGRELGKTLVERNSTLKEFLLVIQSQCDINAEAEAMEHYLSRPTIEAIEKLVEFMQENPSCYQAFKSYRQKKSPLGGLEKDLCLAGKEEIE